MTNYDILLDCLDTKWGMYLEELVEVSGLSIGTVRKYLGLGIKDGYVERKNHRTEGRPHWKYYQKEDHR